MSDWANKTHTDARRFVLLLAAAAVMLLLSCAIDPVGLQFMVALFIVDR